MSNTNTTEPVVHNTLAIMTEALDTIKATFWIKGDEFTFASGDYDMNGGYTWGNWETVNKAILAELDDEVWDDHSDRVNPEVGKAKVVGVCSIGALALANVTLYDEPLTTWDNISGRDAHSWMAGAALAQTILEETTKEHFCRLDNHNEAGSIIAAWNDADGRTREEVIEMFTKALAHPLATADTAFKLQYQMPGNTYPYGIGIYFASEQEFEDFIAGDSGLRAWLGNTHPEATYTVEEYRSVLQSA